MLAEPFDKRPPEGPLPKLNKYQIVNRNFKHKIGISYWLEGKQKDSNVENIPKR